MEIGEEYGERRKRCIVASCTGIGGVVGARLRWVNFGYAYGGWGTAFEKPEDSAAAPGSCDSAGGCIESSHWEVS